MPIKLFKTVILSSLFSLMTTSAIAAVELTHKPHTWHTVNASDGIWDGRLQMINEEGSFVDGEGAPLTQFTVSPQKPQVFGFLLTANDDFNVAYTLTLVKRDKNPQFVSKACVYVITASAPAKPDVRPSAYNGAECNWKVVSGRGEDFFVV